MNRRILLIFLLVCLLLASCAPQVDPAYEIVEPNREPLSLSEPDAATLHAIIEETMQSPAQNASPSPAQTGMYFRSADQSALYYFNYTDALLEVTENEQTSYYSCTAEQLDAVVEIYNLYSYFQIPKALPENFGQAWTMDEFKFYDGNGSVIEPAADWADVDSNGDGPSYWLGDYPAGSTTFRGVKIGDSAADVLAAYSDIAANAMYGSDAMGWEPMKSSTNLLSIVEDAGDNWIFIMAYYDQDLQPFHYYNYMYNPGEAQNDISGYWSFAMKFESQTLVHLGFFYHSIT